MKTLILDDFEVSLLKTLVANTRRQSERYINDKKDSMTDSEYETGMKVFSVTLSLSDKLEAE